MSEDLLSLFDRAPLNRRYWFVFALMAAVFMFDFFDFVIVGYLLAAVAPEWYLTYGQSAVILYSGGIGAIAGAFLFGAFADAWGRKKQVVIGTFTVRDKLWANRVHSKRCMAFVRDASIFCRSWVECGRYAIDYDSR